MTTVRLTGAIQLPDGAWIRGRGLRRPAPEGVPPDYGLYLGSKRLRRQHDHELTWQHEWIEWPDFGLPRDRERAVDHIRALYEHARADTRVEVACGAGIGRTGTVIAALAALAGLPPTETVAWTRTNYHHRAVETPRQRAWVADFPGLS